jgi:citrate lyase beta subunit
MKETTMDIQRSRTFLFVPANRPERIDKALASGADAVIVDLEDAVAPDAKDAARHALSDWLESPCARPVLVRVNGAETRWHAADLAACRSAAVAGVVLPKAESAGAMAHAHAVTGKPVLPIIESGAGLHQLLPIASAPGCARLVFGKLDLAIDLGLEQGEEDSEETVFQPYRAQLVLASRMAGLGSPVDGIFTALDDSSGLAAYTRRARRDGFGALLLIHPRQVATVTIALAPSALEIDWARRVLAAALEAGGSAAVVDGRMIDAPVIARAQRLLAAAGQ